jgi:hypothetical protein
MNQPGNASHIAQWSGRWDKLVIIDPAGNVVESLLTEPAGDRPSAHILWHNGWIAFPGTEWEEEPPGQWSRPVFPDSEMSGGR